MTWGQGYQRLPSHMERISGRQPQQLLLPLPASIFYSVHACTLLKTQTQKSCSSATTQPSICPQPCNTNHVTVKSLNTFLQTPHVLGIVSSFSHLVETYQWFVFQHCNAFPNRLFGVFQVGHSAVICLTTFVKLNGFFWPSIAVSDFSCVAL